MKNTSRLAAALLAAALLGALAGEGSATTFRPAAATSPAGTVPNVINYQGRLVDNGFPVNGLRNVSFRLYDALTGPVNLLWSSGAQTVSVNQGLFGTTLAISTQALAGATQKFLEVQVDAQVLSPREPLNAVPYALVAKSLEDNVNVSSVSVGTTLISSGTLAVSSIQALNGSTSFAILSPMVFAGGVSLGLGTNNPATLLHMSSGTLTIDGNAAVAMTALGNVGVGITGTPPNAKLQVANSVSAGPGSPDLIVGNGFPSSGSNTQLSIYRGAAFSSYIGIDSYISGAGGTPLILNGANSGRVGVGVASFSPGALLDVDGDAQFGAVGTKSVFSAGGALNLANNSALTLTGATGNIVNGASVTASAFFGNGSALSNVPAVSVPASGVTAGTFQNSAYTFQNTLVLSGAARLGLGTINPAQKIHLSSGTLIIDGNVGASIQATGSITAGSFSGPVSGNATTASALVNSDAAGQSAITAINSATAGTINVARVNAASANTGSTIVARDGSGNFSAGTITATLSGNATTATTGDAVANTAAAGLSAITAINSSGSGTINVARVNAASTNTGSTIVARDGSGNFSAGTITATLSGNASNISGNLPASQVSAGTLGAGAFTFSGATQIDASGNVFIKGGANTVVRCLTAGTLPIGALTINGTACGSSTDTGLRVP